MKTKCSKCAGELSKTDGLFGIIGDLAKDGSYDKPTIPIYECSLCKAIFTEDELSIG